VLLDDNFEILHGERKFPLAMQDFKIVVQKHQMGMFPQGATSCNFLSPCKIFVQISAGGLWWLGGCDTTEEQVLKGSEPSVRADFRRQRSTNYRDAEWSRGKKVWCVCFFERGLLFEELLK